MSAPETPLDSPLTMADVLAADWYRDLSQPKLSEGGPAADFTLPLLDGARSVRLFDLLPRPVALVFGSYT